MTTLDLDLSPVTLLLQEIQTVTSAMRRNQRWAHVSNSGYGAGVPSVSARGKRVSPLTKGKRHSEDDGDLMLGFVELRRSLAGVLDITTLTPLDIVDPFIALVRSPLTSGPITSLSLTSLHSLSIHILPLYFPATKPPVISPASPLQIALAHVTAALAQCRFPSSSPQQDELVLLRLLRVIEALTIPTLPSRAGTTAVPQSLLDHMGDEGVCELLEVGLGMLARGRLSEGLRGTAQLCVQAITRTTFLRLKSLRPEDVELALKSRSDADKVKETVVVATQKEIAEEEASAEQAVERPSEEPPVEERKSEEEQAQEKQEEGEPSLLGKAADAVKPPPAPSEAADEPEPPQFLPYGLPTMLELLRVLIALLNPTDQAHTDSMRMSALAVLNAALEVGGKSIGTWPELREGVRDEGCRYLFQLTRADSPVLLTSSLRTTSTLFATLLPHLKPQLELFLSYLIDRLTPPTPSPLPPHLRDISRPTSPRPTVGADGSVEGDKSQTPPTSTPKPFAMLPPMPAQSKELWLESLAQIATRPSFMVDCYVNFDCSVDSEDIFERLIAFLTRGVFPAGPPKQDGSTQFDGLDNSQLLCLEILLSFIGSMALRLEFGDEPWPANTVPVEQLAKDKDRKAVLIAGIEQFNVKPKVGLEFLRKNGVIVPDDGPGTDEDRMRRATARFLKSSSRLDKRELGDYISRPDQIDLLKEFIGLFDFKGKTIADALREMLETFRLPGEAQPIGRITEVFADHFFSFGPPEIASTDAVYVLAYSVIMLNTDLHNPQNRKRMTIEDYKRNVRGCNDGKDFDPEYLTAIHDSIRKREIILPEEHAGQHGFDYAWKTLMQRSRTSGLTITCNTAQFDREMFKMSWRPMMASLAYAFMMSSADEHVIQHAITGFRQCATLASHFNMPEVFDNIVQSLAPATGLLDETPEGYQMGNHPTAERDGVTLTVSPLAIHFGQSYRSQLATVVLFTIANGNSNDIREGWPLIFEMFQTLFLHSLLPSEMLQMEDFLAGTSTIPLKAATPVPERRPEGSGLLSTLSSYLLSPYGQTNEPVVVEASEEDIENALVAVDSLASCRLEELYAEILTLGVDSLIPALRAIRQLAEARTTQKLAPRETPDGPRHFDGQLAYDPACAFHLEMMVSLAAHGKEHIAESWPIIFEYISALLNSAQSYPDLLIERAVVGLLRLCLAVSEQSELRDQLYIALDVLRSLPSTVLNSVSEQLMAGVARILEKDAGVAKSQTEWGLILALFSATVAHPEASKVTMSIVQKMVTGTHPGLTTDNFSGVVALLDEFATAAGAAAASRQPSRRGGADVRATLGPTLERGLTALDSLYELRNLIPGLIERSGKTSRDAFNTFWLPPLLVISKQCVNGHREIRSRAIGYLQRLLLSPQLMAADADTLPIIFDRVLFPVLDELLKPQVHDRDPQGAIEMRLRAAPLLCKVFLQYVVGLTGSSVVGPQFVRVLDKLERFMRGDRDMLNEVAESLKNVVLVMYSSKLLVPPPAQGETRTQDQIELWNASAPRVERMIPGFLDEALQPDEEPVVPENQEPVPVAEESAEEVKEEAPVEA
ncbi:golgi family-specific brefeldin a-resistance guanine nucleotide exchange factor 1 [Trichosporon asahii var. asahii CBS 2479]|uniref:Golgi family-specific brefeldin a-resistance guanine nucleotide exchange factor 1 n=1 Tax=Trichosporon asahii var. asahii (strain ATCC 90039 / CBS 2479 / JCM 2466 / KCTC 7840 / NBRC 103889/ NCYC 2677 / UAMH 7654) TaxID=1186058 RepID=J8TJ80_TRIAS|nr:golgi family-specific brefeldin a-resistance guanine nucleotide exchange factor 1 [Trichosporon asahii var. asahii CBS 2479]EJT53226.1 golgi family-specific brefeldin a-resistance guanine nucleotide exchange factor 1 [Trichosporon asahii var. asahii CBS 2479]